MASGRFISKTVAHDPALARLTLAAETLYLKAIPHLDRDGLITGQPLALLGMISPMRFSELQAQMQTIVDEWIAVGLVTRYGPDHSPALFFHGFTKHQRIRYDRETPSVHPAPPGYIRTETGLQVFSDITWIADDITDENKDDSGFLAENPDLEPKIPESAGQVQEQEQAEEQEQVQEQQQQQGQARQGRVDAADAAAGEKQDLLRQIGIGPPYLDQIANDPRLSPADLQAWIDATSDYRGNNRAGYLIRRWQAHDPPPAPTARAAPDDEYQALKRQYVGNNADLIEY